MNRDSTHEELLVLLCRLDFSDEIRSRITGMLPDVRSWKSFVGLANEHGVSALVSSSLEKLGLHAELPEQYSQLLHNSLLVSLTRNTYLLDKLTEAAATLAGSNIDIELLKGMALELSLYGNCGLRQMNDVDVLIDRDRCIKAWNLLKKSGFTSPPMKSPLYKLIPLYEGKHLPELYQDDLSLEIHHNLFPGNLDITRRMISERSSLIINRVELSMPPPDLHFLYLVKHLQYHESQGDSQIRLYTDLFLLIEHYREYIFTDALLDLAGRIGISGYLAGRLIILRNFWAIELPQQVEEMLKTVDSRTVLDDFSRFLTKPKGHPPTHKAESFSGTLRTVPGVHRKIIHIMGELFPSLTFMKSRYKTPNRFVALLYYPIRWARMIYLLLNRL